MSCKSPTFLHLPRIFSSFPCWTSLLPNLFRVYYPINTHDLMCILPPFSSCLPSLESHPEFDSPHSTVLCLRSHRSSFFQLYFLQVHLYDPYKEYSSRILSRYPDNLHILHVHKTHTHTHTPRELQQEPPGPAAVHLEGEAPRCRQRRLGQAESGLGSRAGWGNTRDATTHMPHIHQI